MSSSLSGRLVRGLGANAFGNGVTIAIQLLSVPIFLRFWGERLYGEWLIVTAIPWYLGMSDLGFSVAAGNSMTMAVARDDREAALGIYHSGFVFLTAASAVILGVVVSVARVVPIERWLGLRLISHDGAVAIIELLALYVAVGFYSALVSAGFRCVGKYAVGVLLYHVGRMAEATVIAVGVWRGISPVSIAAAMLAARACSTGVSLVLLRVQEPWLRAGVRCGTRDVVRALMIPAASSLGVPVGAALSLQGMITLLGVLMGPVAVVTFSTMRTVSRVAFQVMMMVNNSFAPEVSAAFGRADILLMRRLHRFACRSVVWLAGVAVLFLALTGRSLLTFWTHGAVAFDSVLFGWLLLSILANSLWLSSSTVLVATNNHQRMALLYVTSSVCSLVVARMLVPRFGLAGAGASLLVIDGVMVWYVVRVSIALTRDNLRSFVNSILSLPSTAEVRRLLRLEVG